MNQKIQIVAIFILINLQPIILNGQIQKTQEGRFKKLKLHKQESHFEGNPTMKLHFKKFNSARKAQRAINFTSIGLHCAVLGVALKQDDIFEMLGVVYVGGGMVQLFSITGNVITQVIKNRHKEKLLAYTSNSLSEQITRRYTPYVKVGLSRHGIGLTYNF